MSKIWIICWKYNNAIEWNLMVWRASYFVQWVISYDILWLFCFIWPLFFLLFSIVSIFVQLLYFCIFLLSFFVLYFVVGVSLDWWILVLKMIKKCVPSRVAKKYIFSFRLYDYWCVVSLVRYGMDFIRYFIQMSFLESFSFVCCWHWCYVLHFFRANNIFNRNFV